jgi:hypothetical protein
MSCSAVRCAIFSDPDESCFAYWHRREPLQPVGPGWEHSGNAVSPSIAGNGVLHDERAIA